MSQSPTSPTERSTVGYRRAWSAIQSMIREGESWSGNERNCAFLNVGDGRFANCSAVTGLNLLDDGRAAGAVDWDLDGDLDLWVSNRTGPRLRFLRNDTPRSDGFLTVRLVGRSSNRDAIGARLELYVEGRRHVRSVCAGDGFLAQSSKWVHFGLGAAREIDRLVVRWPGGEAESFAGLAAGRRYVVTEGEGARERTRGLRELRLAASAEPASGVSDGGRVVLAARPPMPELTYLGIDGESRPLAASNGRALLINLWASWCAPCRTELDDFERRGSELESQGLSLVALSADDEATRAKAMAFLGEVGAGVVTGYATPELVRILETMQRALVSTRTALDVPTSLLVDAKNRLAAIYRGPVGAETVLSDLALLPLEGPELRAAASPFPGRWYSEPAEAPLEQIARDLLIFDQPAIATKYLEHTLARNGKSANAYMTLGAFHSLVGDDASAIPYYRTAIELDPGSVKARLNLGAALRRHGRFEASIPVLRDVLRLDPGYPEAAVGEALSLVRLARWKEAARGLERARSHSPGSATLLGLHARLLAACPDPEVRDGGRAEDLARAALELERSLVAFETLAMALAERGRYAEASDVQERVVEVARLRSEGNVVELRRNLELYRSGSPCRVPWADDDPLLSPAPLTPETAGLIE